MRILKITSGIALVCLIAASCTRKNDLITDPEFPKGGVGGKGVLRVTAKHHGKKIDSCIMYIKYNATVRPVGSAWDKKVTAKMDNGTAWAVFDSLSLGHYYLYAEGWDPEVTMDTAGAAVYGGGPFTIIDSTKTYDLQLDVTEKGDHVHTPQD